MMDAEEGIEINDEIIGGGGWDISGSAGGGGGEPRRGDESMGVDEILRDLSSGKDGGGLNTTAMTADRTMDGEGVECADIGNIGVVSAGGDGSDPKAGAGRRWPNKKQLVGIVIASTAFLLFMVGLGAGIGTKNAQTAAAASYALRLDECLREEEEEKYTEANMEELIPTELPTTYVPTSYWPTQDVYDAETKSNDLGDYGMEFLRNSDDGSVRRELSTMNNAEDDNTGLVHKKATQRLGIASAKKQRERVSYNLD